MSPEKQKIVDRIKHISQAGLIISFALVVALQLIPDIWHIELPQVVKSVIKNTFITLFFLSFATLLVSSFWSTDDEKEERKNEIKEAVREVVTETESANHPIFSTPDVYDPFVESVTEDQKKIIEQLLHDLPSHREKRDVINLSVVSRFLTALVELELISKTKSADLNALRIWVEKTTGKQAPEQFRFNDAFPSTYKPGIKRAKEQIKQVLKI